MLSIKSQYGTISLDLIQEESVSDTVTVSSFPRESGFSGADGVTPAPTQLRITGAVSDKPPGGTHNPGHAIATYMTLKSLMTSGEELTVTTDTRQYQHMVISSLGDTRVGNGKTKIIQMTLQEIVTVETKWAEGGLKAKTTKAKSKTPQNKSNTDKGKMSLQPTKASWGVELIMRRN